MLFKHLSASARRDDDALKQGRAELLQLWEGDPWEWLTGRDLDGRPIIWTRDEKDDAAPVKPFPTDKPYLKRLVYDLYDSEAPVFVDKSRQMMVSTTVMLLADWYCKFREARNVLVSKQKEAEAEKLIREKLRHAHGKLPEWVQAALPISRTPANRVDYPGSGSVLHGVAQNFAVSEARGTTASLVIVDEAAYQDATGDIIDAVASMSSRLWLVTTPLRFSKGGKVFYDRLERA
jgi:hypothetical protein